ncbi:unnamed protein product [Symbiodinium pilosum]|uniref:Uncharacterized protein n=1 Tax=Symbiodinium pilosum TaxID=2952 RepID=A0A812W4L9_SYMPI|nr:unnamed protein product [Symbiodinium pilosum]
MSSAQPRGTSGKAPVEEEEDVGNCPMFASRQGNIAEEATPNTRMLRVFRMVPKDVVQSIHSTYWLLVGGPVPRHMAAQGMRYEFHLQVAFIRLAFRIVVCGLGALAVALTGRRLWRWRASAEGDTTTPAQ